MIKHPYMTLLISLILLVPIVIFLSDEGYRLIGSFATGWFTFQIVNFLLNKLWG
jgi:hypothetical protein